MLRMKLLDWLPKSLIIPNVRLSNYSLNKLYLLPYCDSPIKNGSILSYWSGLWFHLILTNKGIDSWVVLSLTHTHTCTHAHTHRCQRLNHCSSSERHHRHSCCRLPLAPWRHHGGRGRTGDISLWSARSFSKRHIQLLRESRQLQPHLPSRPCGRYPSGEVVAAWLFIYSNASLYPHSVPPHSLSTSNLDWMLQEWEHVFH